MGGMGFFIGGGDMMFGGDLTPRVVFVSTGAEGSGDGDVLPFMEANGVLPSNRGPGERLRLILPGDFASPVFNDFIIMGDGVLLSMVCS